MTYGKQAYKQKLETYPSHMRILIAQFGDEEKSERANCGSLVPGFVRYLIIEMIWIPFLNKV